MRRSTRQFGLWALVSALIACGTAASAAPPAPQPVQGPTVAAHVAEAAVAEATATPVVDGPICQDSTEGPFATGMAPAVIEPLQTGQPCCTTLCDAICGVGEACFCKRCQVLGCGV